MGVIRARFLFLICVFLVITFSGCGSFIALERDAALTAAERLQSLYAEAESLLAPAVRGGEPLSPETRLRLMEIRAAAVVLFEQVARSAETIEGGQALLLRLAAALLDVLP